MLQDRCAKQKNYVAQLENQRLDLKAQLEDRLQQLGQVESALEADKLVRMQLEREFESVRTTMSKEFSAAFSEFAGVPRAIGTTVPIADTPNFRTNPIVEPVAEPQAVLKYDTPNFRTNRIVEPVAEPQAVLKY